MVEVIWVDCRRGGPHAVQAMVGREAWLQRRRKNVIIIIFYPSTHAYTNTYRYREQFVAGYFLLGSSERVNRPWQTGESIKSVRKCAIARGDKLQSSFHHHHQHLQKMSVKLIVILCGVCFMHLIPISESLQQVDQLQKTIDGSSVRSRSGTNGTARFLFNQIFSIANLIGGVAGGDDDDDDDDDDARNKNCTCECGHSNQENRIVGGRPTGVNKYPWIARLVYDGHFHCGASLLTQDYVLTAAHCVRKLKRSKIRVVLGDHDQTVTSDAPAKMRAVASIIRHRNFDGDSYNHDIALLKLRKPVEFAKNIRPICLPKQTRNFDPAGKTGTVVGWGRTSEGGTLPGIVQEVQVPILSLSQCRAMKYRSSRITNYMLCAGRSSQDSCQGDSGGPLVIPNGDKFEIVGIVSWGVGCGRPGYPGVYTRVSKYLNWLKYNLENTCLCT